MSSGAGPKLPETPSQTINKMLQERCGKEHKNMVKAGMAYYICGFFQVVTTFYNVINPDPSYHSHKVWMIACGIISSLVVLKAYLVYNIIMASAFLMHEILYYAATGFGLFGVGLGVSAIIFFDKNGGKEKNKKPVSSSSVSSSKPAAKPATSAAPAAPKPTPAPSAPAASPKAAPSASAPVVQSAPVPVAQSAPAAAPKAAPSAPVVTPAPVAIPEKPKADEGKSAAPSVQSETSSGTTLTERKPAPTEAAKPADKPKEAEASKEAVATEKPSPEPVKPAEVKKDK